MNPETIAASGDVDISALPPGATIGRYQVVSVLGQGGFGITYRARDTTLGRDVAIKEYLPTALAYREGGTTVLPRSTKVAEDFTWGRERFVAEGRTMATLHQAPGIVRVHDFLEINGTAYIVMEMLQGDTLEGHLKKHGKMDAAAIDRILWPLLDGLEQVHEAGFLHRDIKPANILLNAKGQPTLIDFGASRAAMVGRTVAMTAVFTPGYAAAEQFTSAKQGAWTDIYGLSATLYHAITGGSPPSAFERMLDDAYEPVARHAPRGFTSGLLAGIDAGLAVRASDRPQSIAGWRPILSLVAAPADAATAISTPRRGVDPNATVLGSRPAPVMAPAPVSVPTPPPEVIAQPAAPPSPAAAGGNKRMGLYAGIAVALLVLAGGGYFMLAPKTAALQDLKVEELERVLNERRTAEAAAVEKKRLEEEAIRKAAAETAAKQAADVGLEKARQERQRVENELKQLRADADARLQAEAGQRQQADAVAQRAAEEAAQRKAEAEIAALKQAEEDARRKAVAEAEAKRQADEALAKAQAERLKADAEAKVKAEAEAKQKAEATTKQVAEAEAKAKLDAEAKAKVDAEAKVKADAEAEKKAAETAETVLRLTLLDRQHVQVALTSLGFDTRGSDGAFGPRSREMIANWQKARTLPATGFLTAAQNQALQKEAAAAITRFDDEQKKLEDDKKKAEEARKKAEEEAKAKPVPAPAPAAPTATAPATAPNTAAASPTTPANAIDGTYKGTINFIVGGLPAVSAQTRTDISVDIANGSGSGGGFIERCSHPFSLTLTISPTGNVRGESGGFDTSCAKLTYSVRGSVSEGKLILYFTAAGFGANATLTRRGN